MLTRGWMAKGNSPQLVQWNGHCSTLSPIHVQVPEVKIETEVYELLQSEPDILPPGLLLLSRPHAA